MDVKVVIGANYGDEGKGFVTSLLVKQAQSKNRQVIVVLNNGGAQRGHTVVDKDIRHVFHHFGSGTLLGADTFITENFVVNPMAFVDEYDEIRTKTDKDFKVFVDPNALVTTPFEMIINQIVSKCLDVQDSCGFGIWETVKPGNESHTVRWYRDAINNHKESDIVNYLKDKEYRLRLKVYESVANKISSYKACITSKDMECITSKDMDNCIYNYCKDINFDGLIEHWIQDLKKFFKLVFISSSNKLEDYQTVIFENGQGLLLDKNIDKEYGTPSYTGSEGAVRFIRQNHSLNDGINNIEFVYVSRRYITRHGKGPMIGYPISMPDEDKTNVYNEHQGRIRCSTLDIAKLYNRIYTDIHIGRDLSSEVAHNNLCNRLFITHNDHLLTIRMTDDLVKYSKEAVCPRFKFNFVDETDDFSDPESLEYL